MGQPPRGAPIKAVLSIIGEPKITTQFREVQEEKAEVPMEFTEVGMETEVREVQN